MSLMNKMQNMIRYARLILVKSDAGQYRLVQVTYNRKPTTVHIVQPYGLASSPPLDSEVVIMNVNAEEANKIGFADKSIIRFKNLKEGEVVVGNPVTGSRIFFDEDGNVNKIVSNNSVVTIEGDETITVTGTQSTEAATVTITSTGTATITAPTLAVVGDMTVTGTITAEGSIRDTSGTNTKTMADMRTTYNGHTHDENGTGGGTTDAPNQPI